MTAYLYRSKQRVSAQAVQALLATPPAPLQYILQESASQIKFFRFSERGRDWQLWPEGRAFGEHAEVRWLWEQNGFHLLVVSDAQVEALADEPWEAPQKLEEMPVRRIFLWGQHWDWLTGATKAPDPPKRHEWVQASIPKPLPYPLGKKRFAYIEAVDCRQDGMVILTRFRGLGGQDKEDER